MASGTDNASSMFPMHIKEAIRFVVSRYGLERAKATSAVYELLEAGLLSEGTENMPFLETPAHLKVPLERLDEFVSTLYPAHTMPPGDEATNASASMAQPPAPTATPGLGLKFPNAQPTAYQWQIAATLPHGLELPRGTPVVRLSDAFGNIITSAQSELRICSPYIEWHGLNLLISSFEDAAARGIVVKLLVRIDDLENPDVRSIEAILSLYDLFGGNLEVRSYSKSIEQGGYSRSLGGVHSKMLIADGALFYAGSGEIRDHALSRNFELGFVCSDSYMAQTALLMFEAVWAISEPIEADYCRITIG